MRNSLNYLKDLLLKNRILVLLLIVAIVSIIILFVGVARSPRDISENRPTTSTVEGINTNAKTLDDLNLPTEDIDDILQKLNNIVDRNGAEVEISAPDVVLRDGSIKVEDFSNTDLDFGYVNLIADIPKVKQSYQVTFHTQTEREDSPYIVSCLYDKSKVKYKDFSCKDSYGEDPKYKILGYYAERSSVNDAGLYLYEDSRELSVDTTSYNGSDEEAIADAKRWVESMGFSTDGIKFVAEFGGGAPPPEQPGGVPSSPDN